MDMNNLTKKELLIKCDEIGYIGYKTKKKDELIELINNIDINYLCRKKLVTKCLSLKIQLTNKKLNKEELIQLINNAKLL